MKSLLMVAGAGVYARDGYRTRISMEIEMLKHFYHIILLMPAVEGKSEDFGSDVEVRYFVFPNCRNRILRRLRVALLLRKKVCEIVDETGCIVYGEALKMSIPLIPDIGIKYKFIFDCHGTEPDEYYLYRHNALGKIISLGFKTLELLVVRRSNAIVTVTNKQFERWKVTKKHVILPMLPGQHFFDNNNYRILRRNEMNIPNDALVFVYSGNNQKWQMCGETLKLFADLELRNPNLFLVIYTQAIDFFEKLIKECKIKNALVKNIDYNDVPSYLDAGDFGFCLRDNSIINQVASPTKVMEYLARNVKPILSNHVGDFSEVLGENAKAIVLNDGWNQKSPEISYAKFNGNEGREYIIEIREQYIKGYFEMIRDLFNE